MDRDLHVLERVVPVVGPRRPDALRQFRRRRKAQRQHRPRRRPGQVGRVRFALPGEALLRLARLVADESEGDRVRDKLIFHFRVQIGVIRLSLEAPDVAIDAVQPQPGFRFDAAQERPAARHQVVEGDGGGVGRDAEDAADQAVRQDDLCSSALRKTPAERLPDSISQSVASAAAPSAGRFWIDAAPSCGLSSAAMAGSAVPEKAEGAGLEEVPTAGSAELGG